MSTTSSSQAGLSSFDRQSLLSKLGVETGHPGACTGADRWIRDSRGQVLVSINPSTGLPLGEVISSTRTTYDQVVRIAVKQFETLIADKKNDEAQAMIPELYKAIDKAVKRGVIKANTGSRKKSRLIARLQKTTA